jgi:hypothetical protein
MIKNRFINSLFFTAILIGAGACQDQLDVGNPNAPSLSTSVNSEAGIISLAQGGVYINGFNNGDVWLGDSYFSLPWGYIELMADVVGADASNNQITTIGVPDYIILDNGTKKTNSASSIGIIRSYNTRAATGAGNNPLYYQWLNMYALNNACNVVLSLVDNIKFTNGDAASKANTIKAWCYWWKGYAYASVGTMYYSGLITEKIDPKNNVLSKVEHDYVLHDEIINQSNTYFNLAASTLDGITSVGDYTSVLGRLIPDFTQVGNGGILTIAMWKRNINTMLARNILLNKLSPFVNGNPSATITKSSMTPMITADWNKVLNYTTNGIKKGDFVFTGRAEEKNSFFSATGGTVAALTTGVNTKNTFKISERFIQNFKPADKRFTNNFTTETTYKNDYTFTTRYNMEDGGAGANGVYVYGAKTVGDYELLIAGSYEENTLMLAEANIRLGNIDAGLDYVDAVRNYMGAGIPPVANTGLSLAGALTELVKERRVALVFRGLSFYDSRRWGWIYDISKGGGSYGNTLFTSGGSLNTNVTINYNFMDYWDVPADEAVLNPPSASSAPVQNPNY